MIHAKYATAFTRRTWVIVVSSCALLGVAAWLIGSFALRAATPTTTSFDPENGSLSGVTTIADSSASGAKAVQFGSPDDSATLPVWGAPIFRDEFTGTTVDPTKWNIRDRSDLGLLFDAGIPDKNQVSVYSGLLHVKADWLDTPVARPAGQSGPPLTHKTGYIDQRSLKAGNVSLTQQYGRWEIRAKMPTGPQTYGALSAFWLRNSASGEIDIVESWGHNTTPTTNGQFPGSSTLTIHSHTAGSSTAGYQKKFWRINEELDDYSNTNWSYMSNNIPLTPAYNQFRVWAFEYTPTYLAGYYEGRRYAYTTPAETPWLWEASYFGQPFHVRLNLHVGPSPDYWGIPDSAHREWTQPLDYQVDYVRIWKYAQ